MAFFLKELGEMTGVEFYQLARLRTAVFVVEQACAYQEIDAIDAQAKHLWTLDEEGQIVSYARIFQQEQTVHFGRVIVAPAYRGQKEGHRLIKEVLHRIEQCYPALPIEIEAQAHLEKFYGQYGFKTITPPFYEDGILHVGMKKEASTATL